MIISKILMRMKRSHVGRKGVSLAVKRKWLRHPVVREWQRNGWLKEEEQDVLEYFFQEWELRNEPVPPPHRVKENTLASFAERFHLDELIETGTFKGRMIDIQKDRFTKISSIEIDPDWHQKAVQMFAALPHISLYFGDSGEVLKKIMLQVSHPVLFWLDAHYCHRSRVKGEKECPIYEELDAIFQNEYDHVLLIDDARLFVGENDYPTLSDLSKYIDKLRPGYHFEVTNDIICVYK